MTGQQGRSRAIAEVVGASTDVGAVRDLNEDAILTAAPVYAVADGMGGHAAGEVASELALDRLRSLGGTAVDRDAIEVAIASANEAILDWSAKRPETVGMGTTISGLAIGEVGGTPHWFVFNVGDSRVYHYANGRLAQVTTDHSEVEELVAAGQITYEQARTHPRRNVVTRSLGSWPSPTADFWVRPARPGEAYVVCSDGLTLELSDTQIAGVLGEQRPAQDTADLLVELTLRAGARDNVSVIVVVVPTQADVTGMSATTAPRSALAVELP